KEKLGSSMVELDFWSSVFDTVLKSTELEAEAKCSLVLEVEELTLETQDAKPVVIGNMCIIKVRLVGMRHECSCYRRRNSMHSNSFDKPVIERFLCNIFRCGVKDARGKAF
ncbi:hypothetical protein Tco_0023317, partial [Tanacetum coccineum]